MGTPTFRERHNRSAVTAGTRRLVEAAFIQLGKPDPSASWTPPSRAGLKPLFHDLAIRTQPRLLLIDGCKSVLLASTLWTKAILILDARASSSSRGLPARGALERSHRS